MNRSGNFFYLNYHIYWYWFQNEGRVPYWRSSLITVQELWSLIYALYVHWYRLSGCVHVDIVKYQLQVTIWRFLSSERSKRHQKAFILCRAQTYQGQFKHNDVADMSRLELLRPGQSIWRHKPVICNFIKSWTEYYRPWDAQ